MVGILWQVRPRVGLLRRPPGGLRHQGHLRGQRLLLGPQRQGKLRRLRRHVSTGILRSISPRASCMGLTGLVHVHVADRRVLATDCMPNDVTVQAEQTGARAARHPAATPRRTAAGTAYARAPRARACATKVNRVLLLGVLTQRALSRSLSPPFCQLSARNYNINEVNCSQGTRGCTATPWRSRWCTWFSPATSTSALTARLSR